MQTVKNQSIQGIVFLTILSIIFIYVCGIGVKNLFRYNMFLSEYKELEKSFYETQVLNQQLKQRLLQIEDVSFLEMQIKKKLGYVHDGEIVYYLSKKGYK